MNTTKKSRRATLVGALAVASLSIPAVLVAGQPASAVHSAEGTAAGRVVFAGTREHPRAMIRFFRASAGGYISVRGTPDATARASASGTYRSSIAAGAYAVVIGARGYARHEVLATVTPSHTTTVKAVTLHRKGTVTGRVTTAHGKGIRGARVYFSGISTSGTATAKTTTKGRFTVELAAGRYRQHIEAKGFGSADADRKVRVRSAQTTAEPAIRLKQAGSVSGAVFDSGGAPIPNLPMLAYRGNAGDNDEHDFATGAEGRFHLGGLTPGIWRIEYNQYGDGDENSGVYTYQTRYVEVTAGTNTAVADVTLLGGPAPTVTPTPTPTPTPGP